MTKTKLTLRRVLLTFLSAAITIAAGISVFAAGGQSPVWQTVDNSRVAVKGRRLIVPDKFVVFRADQKALNTVLDSAPLEFTDAARDGYVIFEVPTPEGKLQRFRLEESPMLAPNVAAEFPTWKTFSGQGIDDPTATARFDININGFHGYVFGANGTYLINPYSEFDRTNYIVYYKSDLTRDAGFACRVDGGREPELDMASAFDLIQMPQYSNGTALRTIRLAVSATKEYTNFFGGNVNNAFAGITTSINRMIAVYRRELAVTFTIVSNTSTVYTTANNGGFPDASDANVADASTTRNQIVLDTAYGTANYDMGHVVSRTGNPNGLAASPSLCNAAQKAEGFTGAPIPQGDGFDVDYLAHEIGHQFGMSHTFNNLTDGSCNGSRSATSAFEPASGVTIMGYGGICGPRNLSSTSIEYFHARSLEQSLLVLADNAPGAGGCGTSAATTNIAPVVNAGAAYTIPKLTPFTLTGSATDATTNGLTYAWEEYDLGAGTASTGALDTDATGVRPIFRSYNPSTSPSRTFPSLPYILNNANEPPATYAVGTSLPNAPTSGSTAGYICAASEQAVCITGESLPSIARTMNFRLTVRDNFAASGGVADATTQITIAGTGPFAVTSPNTAVTYAGNSSQTVTWDTAGSAGVPVNAANVKISYSTDGGLTFPNVLLASTPNDGSEPVTVPNIATAAGRIKIEAVGNIFFDISNVNFTVTASAPTVRSRADFDGDGKTDVSVFRPSEGNWYLNRSTAGFAAVKWGVSGDVPVPGDYDGDGKADFAVWRPSDVVNVPDFYVLTSGTFVFTGYSYGSTGDIPVTGDFDGDGKSDIAVFRPSTGTWFLFESSTQLSRASAFGAPGDIPVAMDSDGDGKANLTVFRPGNNTWYIARATGTPAQNFDAVQWGLSTDVLVPADYDGDGKEDVAVFRPSNGTWYIRRSTDLGVTYTQFGTNGDIAVPGDYDGDGKYDAAVYRPSTGEWFLNRSTSGFAFQQFGISTDRPIPAAYHP